MIDRDDPQALLFFLPDMWDRFWLAGHGYQKTIDRMPWTDELLSALMNAKETAGE